MAKKKKNTDGRGLACAVRLIVLAAIESDALYMFYEAIITPRFVVFY